MREVAAMLKAIHAQENREAAEAKSRDVIEKMSYASNWQDVTYTQ